MTVSPSATADPIEVLDRARVWVPVCPLDAILPDSGVAALLGGAQVAVFRLRSGALFALDNHDPCAGANVLARGIVGDLDGRPYVASPLHKHRFDLTTGSCLDVDDVAVAVYPVRLDHGVVEVARRVPAAVS